MRRDLFDGKCNSNNNSDVSTAATVIAITDSISNLEIDKDLNFLPKFFFIVKNMFAWSQEVITTSVLDLLSNTCRVFLAF